MTLSVIIVTYNASVTIAQALDSVLSQTYSDVEIVIVDGCSTDDTIAVVESFEESSVHCLVEKDKGIYDAMNKGVFLAEGEWIFFMGADDILYDKNVLKDMVGVESELSGYDVVLGDITFDSDRVMKSSVSEKTKFINTVHHQSAFYKRELFKTFTFNNTYKVSADYELNLKSLLESLSVKKVDRMVCVVGLDGASAKVDYCGYAEEIKIRNRYLPSGPVRTVMNCLTRLRYVAKKIMKFGNSIH